MAEIGRIDIFTKVVFMPQNSSSPRLINIECLYNIFESLRTHEMSRIVFDPFQPKVDESSFASGMTDWKEFYGYIKEEVPPGMS